jgi:hypothetical protein
VNSKWINGKKKTSGSSSCNFEILCAFGVVSKQTSNVYNGTSVGWKVKRDSATTSLRWSART